MVAPPMAYYGGKTRLANKIAALLPPHEHYIEPFAGSLAVLLAKKPSRMETVNDLDGLLMTFWRVLREKPEQLARALMACRASVVISGYPSDLYDLALTGWHRLDIPHMTGQGNDANKARTEVIWSNRPIADQTAFDFSEAI